MRRAAAVVTDSGGVTCHAAIASRELGVPCIVGTHDATNRLRTGQLVTVDGALGTVTAGATVPAASVRPAVAASGRDRHATDPVTATKLYVNLALAERAAEVAALAVDGVGLLSAEFLITEALGRAPPAPGAGHRRPRGVPRPDVGVAPEDHQAVRAAPGRLPHDRLPHERVPRAGGR